MKQRVIVSFAKTKENDLAELAKLIVSKMTKNLYFTTPNPPLATIQTAITAFSDALLKCKDGTKEDTANKNVKKGILENYLTQLGNYVNSIADGDLGKLDSSGFPISKVPEPVGVLDAPKFLEITYGKKPGEIYVEAGKVEKAKGYVLLYMPYPGSEDNQEWYSKIMLKSTGVVTGLKSGTKYVFKVAAFGTESSETNSYNFTDIIEKLIP